MNMKEILSLKASSSHVYIQRNAHIHGSSSHKMPYIEVKLNSDAGTQGGNWGRDTGEIVFEQQSHHGNGLVGLRLLDSNMRILVPSTCTVKHKQEGICSIPFEENCI